MTSSSLLIVTPVLEYSHSLTTLRRSTRFKCCCTQEKVSEIQSLGSRCRCALASGRILDRASVISATQWYLGIY